MEQKGENKVKMAYKYAMTNENGLVINQLITKPKVIDKDNMIQILTVGKENSKPTKAFLLIGQTGAGKTTLLNAIINYIMRVDFVDTFRFSIKDEIGTDPKSTAQSQTEYVTGYLIYHHPGMAVDCNFLIIDSPGLGDTRGKEQQVQIRKQMEKFLFDEKFGVNELHCLGFVVNGTINRRHAYLKEIVQEFESLFGKDTIDITKILATHTDDDSPNVQKVLQELKINAEKLYTFDNGILFSSNRGERKRMQMNTLKWELLSGQYSEFLEDMLIAEPGSLKLSKKVIEEKMALERALLMLRKHIDNRLKSLLQCNSTKRLFEKYNDSMRKNEVFEGEETYTVKKREEINGRFTHAHNCPTCEQTCVYPCTTWKSMFCSCPSGDDKCDFCPCSKNDHNSEGDTITSKLLTRKVTNDSMKRNYEDAKKKVHSTEELLKKLEADAAKYSNEMAAFIKRTVMHITRINEIARIPNPGAPEEHLAQIIEDIRDSMAQEVTDPLDKQYLAEILHTLPEQVEQVVLKEMNQKIGLKNKLLAKAQNLF